MNLKKNEFMLIVDSTNGLLLWPEDHKHPSGVNLTVKEQVLLNVEDSILIEKLDEKWKIKKDEFLKKMREADEEDYKQLWKRIEDFWEKRDKETEDNE